jgi:hypothetical protein
MAFALFLCLHSPAFKPCLFLVAALPRWAFALNPYCMVGLESHFWPLESK